MLKLAYKLNLRVYAKNLLVQRNQMVQEGKALNISQNVLNKKNQESLSYQSFKEGLSLLKINQEQAKNTFLKVVEDKNDLKYEENIVLAQSSLELAKVYFEERNFKKAQNYLEKSFKLATLSSSENANQLVSDIYYHLGICMLTKNKQLAAQNYFENYLEIAGEGNHGEKSLVMKELARILLRKNEKKDVELMLSHALNYFKGQQNSINFFHEAECYQLLGEYYLLVGNYDKMLQNNLKCSTLLQKKKSKIEGDIEKLYLGLSKSFLTAGMKEDEEKALNFLWNSLENFNKLGSEETSENSWIQAFILVHALDILSQRRDHNECRNIMRRLNSENFTRQDFQSDKSYRDFVLSLVQSEMRLGLFEDAYGVVKSNAKYFKNHSNFNYLWSRLAYENENFEESLEKQSLLIEQNSTMLFESYSTSIKCHTKLQTNFLNVAKKWKNLVNSVGTQIVTTEITSLFSFFVQNAQFKSCEAFLLEISQEKALDTQAMKLIYTYLSILSSKKSDFVKANLYLQMTQGQDSSQNSTKSVSSSLLLNKVMESSTIIKDCHQGLANLHAKDSSRYLNNLWNLCSKHLENSELQTAHMLLKEIRRLLTIHGDSALQNKFRLLDIIIDIEVGKLEDAATLLKDAIERMRAYEYGDFTPLMYFLYGDTLKDLNSSGEAMVMWIKAVNTYMKMKGQKCKIASKNALLFENLMSDRSDLLPEMYKETVEKHFKC